MRKSRKRKAAQSGLGWERVTGRRDWRRFGAWLAEKAEAAGLRGHLHLSERLQAVADKVYEVEKRRGGNARRVLVGRTMITKVMSGAVPVPLRAAEIWARGLGLSETDRLHLRRCVLFSHAPLEALELLEAAERQLVMCRRVARVLRR